MADKVKLSDSSLKALTKNGSTIEIINFIVKQSIGKIELRMRYDPTEDIPKLRYHKDAGGVKSVKWVIDFENEKFMKFSNNKLESSFTETKGELIGDLSDLIKKYEFDSVLISRKKTPSISSKKIKEINIKRTTALKLRSLIERIVREEISNSFAKRIFIK